MKKSRDLATVPVHSFFYAADPPGSVVRAYGEIERLVGRVEAWEQGTVGAAAALTEDAENLARRLHGLIAGPRSPRRRVEDEMARIAQRIEHLERVGESEPRAAAPFFLRIRRRVRRQRRCPAGRNKAALFRV